MLKKIAFIFLKFLILLTVLIIFFLIETAYPMLQNSNYMFLRIPLYIFFSFLIVFMFHKDLPKSWNIKRKAIVFFLITLSILSFEVWTFLSDKRLGIKQFNYRYASCTQLFKGILSNRLMDNLIESVVENFNFTQRYMVATAVDACTVFRIKHAVESSESRKNICTNWNNGSSCFREIVTDTLSKPFTITGNILLVAVGAAKIYEEKELNKLKSHPLLTPEIENRNISINNLYISSDLLDVVSYFSFDQRDKSNLGKIFPDFPNNDILLIPENLKKDISLQLNKELEEEVFIPPSLFGVNSKYKKLAPSIDEKVLEAYMLQEVDKMIKDKLLKTSCERLNKVYDKVTSRMNSQKYTKNLTAQELHFVQVRLDLYKSRSTICKKTI